MARFATLQGSLSLHAGLSNSECETRSRQHTYLQREIPVSLEDRVSKLCRYGGEDLGRYQGRGVKDFARVGNSGVGGLTGLGIYWPDA